MPYTEVVTIGTGGWNGGVNGLLFSQSSQVGQTLDVRLWGDTGTGVRTIGIRPGVVLPLKCRYVFWNTATPGITLYGLY